MMRLNSAPSTPAIRPTPHDSYEPQPMLPPHSWQQQQRTTTDPKNCFYLPCNYPPKMVPLPTTANTYLTTARCFDVPDAAKMLQHAWSVQENFSRASRQR